MIPARGSWRLTSSRTISIDFEGDARVRLATAQAAAHPYATGQALARKLSGPPRLAGHPLALILSAVSTTGYENEALRALREGLGPVPVFGGMVSGDYDSGRTIPAS